MALAGSSSSATASTIWAIGDLHSDVQCARFWIQRTNLIGNLTVPETGEWLPRERWHWRDGHAHLVFLGDYIDKGPTARDTLALVRSVQERFPQYVTALLGNHELNLLIDRAKGRGEARYFDYV